MGVFLGSFVEILHFRGMALGAVRHFDLERPAQEPDLWCTISGTFSVTALSKCAWN